jgi:hypothetical protein
MGLILIIINKINLNQQQIIWLNKPDLQPALTTQINAFVIITSAAFQSILISGYLIFQKNKKPIQFD